MNEPTSEHYVPV